MTSPSSTFPACQKGALPRYTSFSKVGVSKIVSPGTPEAPLSPLTSEVPLSLSSSSRDTSKVTFPSPLVSPSLRPSVLPLVMDPSNSTMKPVRSAITSPPISPTTSAPISPEILRRLQSAAVNKVVPEQDTTFKKDLTQFERTSEEKNSAIINEGSVPRSELSVSERSSPNENSVTEEDFEKILQAEDTVAEVDDQFERIFQNQQDSSPAYDDDEIMVEKSSTQFQQKISQNGVQDSAKQDFLLPSTSRNGGESSKSNNVDDSSSSSIEEPLERPHSSPAQEHRLSIGEYAMCESVSPLSSQSFRERSEVIRRKNSGERRGSTNNSDDPLAERRGSTNSFAEPLAERSSEEDGDGSSGESSEECDVDESRGESSVKEALFLDEGENSGEAVRDERELENKFELEQNGWSHRETNETETEAHSGGIEPYYGANGATKSRVFARKIVESNQANGHVCESQTRKVNQETPEKDIRNDKQKGYDSPLKYRSFFGHDDAGNTDKSTGAVGSKYNSPFTSSSSYRTEFAFNGRTNSENQDKEVDGKDAEVGIGDSSIDRSPKRTENNNNYVNSELTNVGHSLTNGRNGCRTNVDNCSGNMLRNSNRIDESRRDVWSTTNGSDRSQVRTMENQTHHVHQPVDSMTPPSHPKKTLTLADSVETLEFNVDESLNCSPSRRPILKKRSLSAAGVCEVTESTLPHALPTPERMRPILKKKSREDIFVEENGDGSEGNFISGVVEMKTQHRPCSILKKKSRESDSSRDMSRESSYEHVSSDGEIVEVRPILKKKSHESLDSNEDDAPQERVRPILKRRDNSTDISDTVSDYSEPNSPDRVRPILKRRSTSSSRSPSRRVSDASLDAEFDSLTETPEPEFRSILKRSSVEESGSVVFGSSASDYRCSELRRPILKKTSRDETSSPDVTTSPVPILKKSTEDISNDISFESPLHHNSAMSGSSSQSAGDILPSILKRKSLEERSTPVLFNGDYVRQGPPAGGQHGFRPILKRDTSMETEDERCAPRVKIISQDTSSHGACANETPTADASATTVGDRVRAACNQKTDSFSACVNNNDDKQAKASSRACANDRPMVEGSNKIWTPLDKPVAESVASESVAHEEEKTRPLSVLDRIRSLEASTGWNGHLRRTKSCRERYSTQPVTKGDISRIHENGEEVTKPSPSLGSGSSEERKAGLCTPETAGSISGDTGSVGGGESEGVSGSSVSRGDRKILRKISTDRFRTQPVTLGEINSATTALLEPSGHLVSAKSPAGHLVSANSQGVQSPVGTLLARSVDTEADNVWNERSPHNVNNFLSISCDTTLSPSLSSPVASDMLSSADSCSGVGGGLLARGGGPTGGIAARLAALQHNGQSAWRTRVQKEELVKNSTTSSIHQAQDLIRSQLTAAPTPTVELPRDGQAGSLAARLGKLESASHGWKKRVEASDARQFSVAGRMRVNSESADQETSTGTTTTTGSVSPDSPQLQQGGLTPGQLLAERQRRTPRAERFKCKSANNIPHTLNSVSGAGVTTTSSPSTHPTLTRSTSVPEDNTSTTPSTRLINGDARSADSSPLDNNIGDGAGERSYRRPFGQDIASTADEGPTVVVPRMDSDLDEFFVSRRSAEEVKERLEVRIEDFDSLVRSEQQLVNFKKPARVTRRPRGAASKNPIRALNERTDLIREEYTEVITGLADRELKRINIENLSLKNAHLAVEALAGLASKEDFAAVSLKSAASTPAPIPHHELLPYLPLMLLQVKGRRHVQTRLVEPTVTSVNRGDSYVLVTQTEVYHYTGQFANVIEKSRAAEIAQHILVQHDLGCNAANVHTISDTPCRWSRKFWKHLGASEEEAASLRGTEPGHPDEDELYEMSILDTNMIYELQTGGEDGPELVPLDKYWGGVPKIEMLDTNKILVFDFGSELYIWMGKNATLDRRKLAISLCKQLWVRGVDYTDCDISPLGSTNRCSGSRPAWCLLAKVTQHMESCLFREKFADWPDFSRVIRLREENGGQSKAIGGGGVDEIAALSGQSLLEMKQDEPDLVLEGTHLGRGVNFFHEELRKLNEIRTLDTKVWHIEEFETTALPQPSHGQFFSGDSYIIRWHYSVTITGRELSGQPSRHNIIGRDRFVYFIWQGAQASLNEQGAAALLTVQLDEERGPQVRISAGHEGPAFLNIFNGSYVCYEGKRSDLRTARTKGPWRLFTVRGSLLNEAQMLEVACSIRSLRSRACLLLVNVETGVCYLWQGARVSPHNLKVAHSTAQKFIARHPTELGTPPSTPLTLTPIQEGSEPGHFFAGLGTDAPGRALYLSLTGESTTPAGEEEFTPRLFSLSSTLGVFSASVVHSYIFNPELTVPYAYLQSDLYASSQPSLYLLDTGSELWLWQGWWPQDEAEEEPLDQQEQDSTDNISVSATDELVALNSDLVQGHRLGSRAHRWNAERRVAMETALSYWNTKYGGKFNQAEEEEEGERGVAAYLVWAGLEPLAFTNLFQVWEDRDDVAEMNIRDGHKPGELLPITQELAKLTRSTYPPSELRQRPLPEGVDPTKLEVYLSADDFQQVLGLSRAEFTELPVWKQSKMKQAAGLF
uniref:Supervillin n=1 Tax=Cacopsylla melanoneura TaxID=428564 RepID=A0A8D8YEG1_9HEMI